ncbi:hypothetical protein LEP1GSC060_3350 [Leptospira weilii serovar Ranarum str. ICFT]|uniref:Uncharacterized protein n=1 Tax=Leptospira weilii serovar Ranarum str. ICFT TaxID=1218598 RepID=N1WHQ7_9LEPT|nr:hypothetical protein [Leptospira weilii]EMY76862.1 hypothetical protein LEP1GSC060_3350 [Leptospira weilii serovar Ranarum str. ICFT]
MQDSKTILYRQEGTKGESPTSKLERRITNEFEFILRLKEGVSFFQQDSLMNSNTF